jgi:negative regulator of flagellin synthesis FlgM
MQAPFEPRLNRFPVLRYDNDHAPDRDGSRSDSDVRENRYRGHADMDVNGVGSVQGSFPIKPSRPAAEVPRTSQTKPIETNDAVEISPAGKMLEDLSQSTAVRAERLAQIKAAIDAGTYETPEKLEAALSKMLNELGLDRDA